MQETRISADRPDRIRRPARRAARTRGASLVSYGLLTGLIAVGAIGAVNALGGRVAETFETAARAVAEQEGLTGGAGSEGAPPAPLPDPNTAPAFTTAADLGARGYGAASDPIALAATDDDGDPLTFSLSGAPAWLSIDPATGAVTPGPGLPDATTEIAFTARVFDGTETTERDFSLDLALPGSCQDIHTAWNGAKASGLHTIDPDEDGAGAISVHCHMVASGPATGGWTVVARQTESDPQTGWGAGPDDDTATDMASGFALAEADLPADHAHMGVGRQLPGGSVELLDAVQLEYTTGNMSTLGAGAPGLLGFDGPYHIHRSDNMYFDYHDPDWSKDTTEDADWFNTLTFDHAGIATTGHYTWSFSPNRPSVDAMARGYGYGGNRSEIDNSMAWLVFVR